MGSHAFKDHRDALADADAHRRQAERGVAVVHGVDERRGDAGAACAERVADGDRAAADVDLRFVEFEHPDAGQRLGGEGFVELDQVDVGERQAGALEGLLRGRHGAGAHHGRVDAGDGRGANFHERLEAERLGALFAHHQQRGGAVVERRAVAGRHRAHAGHERRLQRGERFQARVARGCTGRVRRACGCPLRRGPRSGTISRRTRRSACAAAAF